MLEAHSAQNLLSVPSTSDPALHPAEKKRNGKSPARPSSPLLRAKNAFRRTFSTGGENVLQREREAKDAVSWLKAAGFPQYVQMYADGEFPINLSQIQVETDHKFLDKAAIESLLRRLRVLNHCADLFVERITKYSKEEDSDEEDLRALSSHWKFQKRSKRWSRNIESAEEAKEKNKRQLLCQSELSRSLSNLRTVKDFSFADGEVDQPLMKTQSFNCFPIQSQSKSEGYFSGNDEPDQAPITTGSQPDLAVMITEEEASNPAVSLPVPNSRNYHTLPAKLPSVQIERPRHYSSPPMLRHADKLLQVSDEGDSPSLLSPVAVFFSGEEFVSSTESILEALANEVSTKVASLRRKGTNAASGTVFQQQPANSSVYGSSSLSDSYEDQEIIVPKLVTDKQSTSELNGTLPAVEITEESAAMIHRRNENARRARHVWHSFQKGHSFRQALKPVRMLIPIDELSVGQMTVLRKLSLVRLTSLLEMHNASSKILSRLSWCRQPRMVQYKDKKVFGVPLLLNVSQTGCALPQAILDAMRYMRKNGLASKGIFRKTAYRSRVSALKELIESNPDYVNYSDFTVYEIADMLKLYFRDLPEVLLTDKLSEVLISVQEGIPGTEQLQALQSIMLLMPDENREALHYLLLFLSEVAEQSDVNQMDIHNLSVCFAPSIFTLPSMVKTSPLVKSRTSSFRSRSGSGPGKTPPSSITSSNNKEVTESMAAHKCLELMVDQVDKLFMIPSDMIHVCQFSYLENADPVPHHELGQDRYGFGDFHSYINTCVNTTLKECKLKAKGWQYHDQLHGIEVSSITVNDDIPLRVWKGSAEIPMCAENVLRRLWSERHLWDPDLIKCRVVSRIDESTEVFQYVTQGPPPLANRDICILRAWRQCRENCFAVVSTSVSHPAATLMGSIRATVLAMRFLIEPTGPNASRLNVLNRIDFRGHSSDYYNRCYGAYSTLCVARIRDSFKKPNEPDYLETEV